MSDTPIKSYSVLRKIGIVFLALALLGGSLHLYLYYQAGELFKAFVEQISNGNYTASTKKLRFGYFPFRIRAVDVKFYPRDTTGMSRRYVVTMDSIQLRVSSLVPIIFLNSLEVREARLVRPMVEVSSEGTNASREDVKYYIPIQEIQNGLLKSLDLLQVDKCVIVDGGFKLMQTDVARNLSVNHIDLTIDSLFAARKGMLLENGDTLAAHVLLSINEPDIEIPDENLHIDVEKLVVDSRKNLFKIDELRFSRKKENEAYDTIKLSTISLKGLNWKRFLNKGIIELDSVNVRNGLAQIDLRDRFIFQKRKDKVKNEIVKIEVPMMLHHVSVQQVFYQLRSQRKTGPFTILLDGDSLRIESFSLVDASFNPLKVGALSLNVRNYYDQDDNKTYEAGFDRLFIRNNNLEIVNYRLVPLKKEGFSANNRIEAPTVILYGYDLGELLNGRLVADRLVLNKPRLILDILQKEQRVQDSSKSMTGLFEVLNRLQRTLDIGELSINDARITLQPRSNLADTIIISELSTDINVERLLSAQSLNDLMRVTEGIRSDGFFITGTRFEFKVTDAVISSGNEKLEMARLQGSLESGLQLDLDKVVIVARPGELLIPVDGMLNLQQVSVGSGAVMVIADKSDSGSAASGKRAPALTIDALHTGPLELSYINKKGALSTMQRLAIDVEGLHADNKKVHWIDAVIEGSLLSTGSGSTNIKAENWYGQFPGKFTMEEVKMWPTSNYVYGVLAEIPVLRLTNNIQSLDWNPESISELEILRPKLRWGLKSGNIKQAAAVAVTPPPFYFKKVTVVDPDLEGFRITKKGDHRNSILRKGIIELKDVDVFYKSPDYIGVGGIAANLFNPFMELDSNWTIQPAKVRLLASDFEWKKGEQPTVFVDSMQVEGIGNLPLFSDEKKSLSISTAGISGWRYPWPNDSILNQFLYGPNWWVGGANFKMKGAQSDLNVYNASASRHNRTIKFDSLDLIPHLGRDSFWANETFEKDYISLKLGATELKNFKPILYAIEDSITQIESVHIKGMKLYVARDKRFPDDTVSYRPLLVDNIKKIPFDIKLDTIILDNGNISYHEISEKSKREGYLLLDNLSGKIKGVHSRPDDLDDSLRIDVTGRFMGTAPLSLSYSQPYFDTMQNFLFDVSMGRWPMNAANPLLGPLSSINFRRGMADSMWLSARGDKYRAYGWMGFKYNKMNIGILKNGYKDRYFMAGAINAAANLILDNNNKGNATPFYVERFKNKAVFNFWAKILTSGMLSNLGVPGKKKAARKAMRKENLPAQAPGR